MEINLPYVSHVKNVENLKTSLEEAERFPWALSYTCLSPLHKCNKVCPHNVLQFTNSSSTRSLQKSWLRNYSNLLNLSASSRNKLAILSLGNQHMKVMGVKSWLVYKWYRAVSKTPWSLGSEWANIGSTGRERYRGRVIYWLHVMEGDCVISVDKTSIHRKWVLEERMYHGL
jgi:hypothetical protein